MIKNSKVAPTVNLGMRSTLSFVLSKGPHAFAFKGQPTEHETHMFLEIVKGIMMINLETGQCHVRTQAAALYSCQNAFHNIVNHTVLIKCSQRAA